ncbi:hypothetical protein GCM10011409_44410 [Lentibacillus populi]|uniref:Resolvase/invertase-type recombinase catalytic domain-containing protein n=1 Tax=Lentibacillus populi TaxID=1827502 RepID=A0A9W5U1W3_9BACI|nr:hypothetical protein GCM10011409_44410 [Lentibacillus populi]
MRCAVYIRVSTDKEEQKASLKYQQDLFFRHIEEKGWDIFNCKRKIIPTYFQMGISCMLYLDLFGTRHSSGSVWDQGRS